MTILLDIDGVLVTTPPWQPPPLLHDGFMAFNEAACKNLALLYTHTNGDIVLTSTHGEKYTVEHWKHIFNNRGLYFKTITILKNTDLNGNLLSRLDIIKNWITNAYTNPYIILDDDKSLHNLPPIIKAHWVPTLPLIGFDNSALEKSMHIVASSKNESSNDYL